jgi:hypothetical protein
VSCAAGAGGGDVSDLRQQPWWTSADRAELDVRTHELVDSVAAHRGSGCEACASGYPPCPFIGAAIAEVVAWRDDRMLRSRAVWLRMRQDRVESAIEETRP